MYIFKYVERLPTNWTVDQLQVMNRNDIVICGRKLERLRFNSVLWQVYDKYFLAK